LEEDMKDKRKRDFEIRLLKGELEKRKKYSRGVPPGPSPEELQEQRERDAKKARNDAEHRLKCKQREEKLLLMVRQREVRANLAIETHYYRKLEATKSKPPKALGCIVIIPELHHKIRAAKDRAKAAKRRDGGGPGARPAEWRDGGGPGARPAKWRDGGGPGARPATTRSVEHFINILLCKS
jgi:hypothetical protein